MTEELTDDNFATQVIDSDTPSVIDFWAEWCVPCKFTQKIMEKLSGEYDGRVKFYRLNTDQNKELAKKLKITDIPTMLFFKDADHIDIQRGTAREDKIRGKIDAMIEGESSGDVNQQ